jgi:hypothetical protein
MREERPGSNNLSILELASSPTIQKGISGDKIRSANRRVLLVTLSVWFVHQALLVGPTLFQFPFPKVALKLTPCNHRRTFILDMRKLP